MAGLNNRRANINGFLKRNFVLLTIFIGVPIILISGYFYTKYSFKALDYLQRENKKYSLVKNQDKVQGVLQSVYSDRGGSFVTLRDSTKIWFEVSENEQYEKHLLCDFLQHNDSLVKNLNSDTLFIYRHKKLYCFKLGQLKNRK
jgi:hypothetical protein